MADPLGTTDDDIIRDTSHDNILTRLLKLEVEVRTLKKEETEQVSRQVIGQDNIQDKKVWSAGGMALRELKQGDHYCRPEIYDKQEDHYNYDVDSEYYNKLDKANLIQGGVFKDRKSAELERDRRECDYIMKKTACESREDNDWRIDLDKTGYFIKYYKYIGDGYECKGRNSIEKFSIGLFEAINITTFNQVFFNTEKDAQLCLDNLIKTYGIKKLKTIWGIK